MSTKHYTVIDVNEMFLHCRFQRKLSLTKIGFEDRHQWSFSISPNALGSPELKHTNKNKFILYFTQSHRSQETVAKPHHYHQGPSNICSILLIQVFVFSKYLKTIVYLQLFPCFVVVVDVDIGFKGLTFKRCLTKQRRKQ